jgi:predicted lipoprotein with Yx(FWY)xxD motif
VRRPAQLALAAVLIAGCGESTPKRDARPSGPPASVRVDRSELGPILVDSRGRALYLFSDDQHGRSSCYQACARLWPPATVQGRPIAGPGLTAKLTTIWRRDHARQLVYNGHPLYTVLADTAAGQMNGQGNSGTWFVVSPAGREIGHSESSEEY